MNADVAPNTTIVEDLADEIGRHLGEEDDPELWAVALREILSDLDAQTGMMVEVGRCSHWVRPHQKRWTADGGFAWPEGYGRSGSWVGIRSLPQFDWSLILRWTGGRWEITRRQSVKYVLRVAIPSRTRRHLQAAVHTLWMTEKENHARFYGFRKRDDHWVCTAYSRLG